MGACGSALPYYKGKALSQQSDDEEDQKETRIQFKSPAFRNVLFASYVCLLLWLFGLPWWARLLNAKFGDTRSERTPDGLCTVEPAEMHCYGGEDFAHLAAAAGRRSGCGCGEGVLGEALCAVDPQGHHISGLIATHFGTGMTALASAIPMAAMWWSHEVFAEQVPSDGFDTLLWWLLAAMQLFFFAIIVTPMCIWRVPHIAVSSCFAAAALLYWGTTAFQCIRHRRSAQIAVIIGGLSAIAVLALLGSLLAAALFWAEKGQWPYGFWLGQCMALCSGLAVAPAILLFGRVRGSSKYSAEASWEDH